MKKLVIAAAFALAACGQTTTSETGPALELYAMNCGEFDVSDMDVFADDGSYAGQQASMVDTCYLIRHPDGDLIWDTGVPEAWADIPEGVSSPPFTLKMPITLTAQLAELGLTPEDIELASISHSHFDHVGNANLFAHATWILDEDERAFMFRDEERASDNFANFNQIENAETRIIPDDEDYDVFGDGSVVLIAAPGHTPGHRVALVRLPQTGPVLLAGDLWHFHESADPRRVPRFNTDHDETIAAMDKIEALAHETGAKVVMQHVRADFESLPPFPEPAR